MAQKKILLVCRSFWLEKNRINDICYGFCERGCQVDVLCGQPVNSEGSFLKGYGHFTTRVQKHRGINIFRTIDVKRPAGAHAGLFLNYLVFPLAGWIKAGSLAEKKYDAVFVYQASPVMMAAAGLRAAKKRNIPLTILVKEIWPLKAYELLSVQSPAFSSFLYKLSMYYYKRAGRLITESPEDEKYLRDRFLETADRIEMLVPGPLKVYEEAEADDDLLDKFAGSFNITLVSDGMADFSAGVIAAAAKEVVRSHIFGIRFIILGKSFSVGELKKEVRDRDLEDFFFFEGDVKSADLKKYLYVSDALLYSENAGNETGRSNIGQIINYMAASKAVIAAAHGNVRSIIRAAGCGYCSETKDAASLGANIIRMYKMDKNELRQLGCNARAYQLRHYNRDSYIDRILDIMTDSGCGEDL